MANEVAKQENRRLPQFRPNTDILEKEDGFHIIMDLPGVDKENLILDLKENELEVRGRVEYPKVEESKEIHLEFGEGEYVRSFTISDAVDQEKIQASLKNGVLELYLPKAEKLKPRKIEISVE